MQFVAYGSFYEYYCVLQTDEGGRVRTEYFPCLPYVLYSKQQEKERTKLLRAVVAWATFAFVGLPFDGLAIVELLCSKHEHKTEDPRLKSGQDWKERSTVRRRLTHKMPLAILDQVRKPSKQTRKQPW